MHVKSEELLALQIAAAEADKAKVNLGRQLIPYEEYKATYEAYQRAHEAFAKHLRSRQSRRAP